MVAQNKRPTLYDVAREAGVSHMTVSRVVRGSQAVREKTAARVAEAILKLGYRPDPALSALAAYRSREGGGRGSVLAFLDCDRTPYSGIVFEGARKEAMLHGYSVERFVLPAEPSRQKQLGRTLFHRGVNGLIFGPSDDLWEFSGWDWKEFAMVSLGAVIHRPAMHSVAIDYFHGAFSACQMMQEQGCRRIGLVVDHRLEARTGHRWLGGFLAAVGGGRKRAVYDGPIRQGERMKDWVKKEKIEAILTIHPEIWRFFRNSGLRIAFLNDTFAPANFPSLVLDPEHIGAEGLRLLHHLLLRRELGLPEEPKMVALRGSWRENFPGSA